MKKTITIGVTDLRSILSDTLSRGEVRRKMGEIGLAAVHQSVRRQKARRPAKKTEPTSPGFDIPTGYRLAARQPKGRVPFDPSAPVALYQSQVQRDGGVINGETWLTECEAAGLQLYGLDAYGYWAKKIKKVPNAQLPEWLRGVPGVVKIVVFAGDPLENTANGKRYVRCLCWAGDVWHEGVDWLGDGWGARGFVATLASSGTQP